MCKMQVEIMLLLVHLFEITSDPSKTRIKESMMVDGVEVETRKSIIPLLAVHLIICHNNLK